MVCAPAAAAAAAAVAGVQLAVAAGPAAAAAQEAVAQVAGDARPGALLAFALPALGWVTWNIAGPGLNQLDKMKAKNSRKSRGVAGAGLGLTGLSLLAADQADAATQEVVGQLAEFDGRAPLIYTLLAAALGWVTWNMAGPTLNQLDNMRAKRNR